ncbi:hypothetical protein H0H92_006360 [Tricholoma furcatifolium]|nr:hypothetical protein H0H92_006360 [Tricholoma furcatifolium]
MDQSLPNPWGFSDGTAPTLNFVEEFLLLRMVLAAQARYRETIVKDGVSDRISHEYKHTSERLGPEKLDTFSLACNLPPPWYWGVGLTLITDYPMALYALTLPWSLSHTSLVTVALYQQAAVTLRQSVQRYRYFHDPSPILTQIQRFYNTLDGSNRPETGSVIYPTNASCKNGMKLSLRNVSFAYNGTNGDPSIPAVDHASFHVEPGQLVVIVGGNGSGKTTLLKLLCGLHKPACGDISIDDRPVSEYRMDSLRRFMAYLSQSEEIYPISLRENLLMGIPNIVPHKNDEDDFVDEAAQLGGAYELMQRLGYDTVLEPPPVVGQSMRTSGNGDIGSGAIEELRRNSKAYRETILSAGEKQRIVTSRTLMRILNSDIKLIVVDEPTSALDPIAESELFNNICRLKEGKTMICVTHHFGHIVKRAHLVLSKHVTDA